MAGQQPGLSGYSHHAFPRPVWSISMPWLDTTMSFILSHAPDASNLNAIPTVHNPLFLLHISFALMGSVL